MSQFSSAAHTIGSGVHSGPRADGLFKDDRPRRIDRFIDYFGDAVTRESGVPPAAKPDGAAE